MRNWATKLQNDGGKTKVKNLLKYPSQISDEAYLCNSCAFKGIVHPKMKI